MIPTHLRGVIFMMLSGLIFMLNDSFMKLAMVGLPPYEVLALRGISATFFALAFLRLNGVARFKGAWLSRPLMLRAVFECGGILTYIIALANAPIGDVTAIFQTTPLLVILGLMFIHREHVSAARLALIITGFAGALLVAQPGQGVISPFVMMAFITACFAAARDLAARQIPQDVPALFSTFILILVVLAGATLCGLLLEHWLMPSLVQFALTFSAGLMVMLGHHFTLLAYRSASAQTVAPFYYSFMLFAVLAGWVIFGDRINGLELAGMVVIAASGLAILAIDRREGALVPE